MPVFAANLSMMFTEWDFLDRFDAAAEAGFTAVEFLFPYETSPEAIGERLARNRLTQALFNLPPGDFPIFDHATVWALSAWRFQHLANLAGMHFLRRNH